MSLVAIQGICGSYSEEAALKMFSKGIEILECRTFAETFQAVISKRVRYAVVPLKNKIVGEITSATSVLGKTDLRILDEFPLEVRHVLVGTKTASFEKARKIRSHVEALKQCRRFLSNHEKMETIIGDDTASSVRRIIAENDSTQTAIGSRRAAEIYGGRILKEDIADDPANVTTFYLVSN
ncbi:MAG: prephenate dehydratase domain-containing protein [Pyrinomonadaceae bacterium]